MRPSFLGRLRNATVSAVRSVDSTAQRLAFRVNCSATAPRGQARASSELPGKKQTPQVSNLGRVRTTNGIVTWGTERTDGYLKVQVNSKSHYVHRLVAKAWLQPPPSEAHTQVNHKDGNRANNQADNLEWVTPKENVQHSYETNATRKSNAPKLSKPVIGWRVGEEQGEEQGEEVPYESVIAAARLLNLNSGNVSACCHETQTQTGGYSFRFAPLTDDQHDLPGEEWRAVVL